MNTEMNEGRGLIEQLGREELPVRATTAVRSADEMSDRIAHVRGDDVRRPGSCNWSGWGN